MRKLIYAINITLDGCCDHTKQVADDKLLEHYTLLLRDADLLVYGRKTYQLMVPYWPSMRMPVGVKLVLLGFCQSLCFP
jgi:dihydrofolate reductase